MTRWITAIFRFSLLINWLPGPILIVTAYVWWLWLMDSRGRGWSAWRASWATMSFVLTNSSFYSMPFARIEISLSIWQALLGNIPLSLRWIALCLGNVCNQHRVMTLHIPKTDSKTSRYQYSTSPFKSFQLTPNLIPNRYMPDGKPSNLKKREGNGWRVIWAISRRTNGPSISWSSYVCRRTIERFIE